ncbi:MAG: helix-turn-helix transcriptional regulator [Firmicutes bacterium]|nr:helix-turn-helix transcriptional regulator [Bacillota bacterium]
MESILTKREKEIFDLLIYNYSILEISKMLGISDKTVRNHISNVIQKLDVNDRCQAIIFLLKINELCL